MVGRVPPAVIPGIVIPRIPGIIVEPDAERVPRSIPGIVVPHIPRIVIEAAEIATVVDGLVVRVVLVLVVVVSPLDHGAVFVFLDIDLNRPALVVAVIRSRQLRIAAREAHEQNTDDGRHRRRPRQGEERWGNGVHDNTSVVLQTTAPEATGAKPVRDKYQAASGEFRRLGPKGGRGILGTKHRVFVSRSSEALDQSSASGLWILGVEGTTSRPNDKYQSDSINQGILPINRRYRPPAVLD
jgi:hypothetical protein